MTLRRIVVGQDSTGKSQVLSDGPPSNHYDMKSAPGFSRSVLWATTSGSSLPLLQDPTPSINNLHPESGGALWLCVSIPPDSSMSGDAFDVEAFVAEGVEHNAGIFDRMEPNSPGMHRTDTIDYGILLEGELWLDLGDDTEICMTPGDTIILGGVRHAWRNKTNKPAKMLTVLIGAARKS